METLINHIIENGRLYFLGTIIAFVALLSQLSVPTFESAFETLGIQNNSFIEDKRIIDSLFGEEKNIILEIQPNDINLLEASKDFSKLENQLKTVFDSIKFSSILAASQLIYSSSYLENNSAKDVLKELNKTDLLKDLISDNNTSFLISIGFYNEDKKNLLSTFEKILNQTSLEEKYRINITSVFHLERAINRELIKDISTIIVILFISFIILMLLAYRSLFAMIYLVLIVAWSMLITLFISLQFGTLNLITIMSLPVIVVLSAADSVHILTGYFNSNNKLINKERIRRVYNKYFIPSLLTSITTSFAFFSLGFNDTTSVKNLGLITGTSIIISFLFCYLATPLLFHFAPKISMKVKKVKIISDFFITRKRIFSYFLIPILFIAIALFPQLKFKNNFELFIPVNSFEKESLDTIRARFDSQEKIDVVLQFKDSSQVAQTIDLFKNDLEKIDHVNTVLSSVSNFVVMSQFFIPIDLAQSSGYQQTFTSNDGLTQRFVVKVKDSKYVSFINKEITEILRKYEFKEKHVTSSVLTYESVNEEVGISLLQSMITSSLFLVLVFFFLTRSFLQSFIGLFANLVPISLIVILFVGFDLHINIMTAITAVVCLGIIVDDTIHSFYRRVVKKQDLGELSYGMLITTIILIVGFGIFAISSVKPVVIFGSVAAAVFAITLICDYTLLLYLIDMYDKYIEDKKT